MNIKQVTFRVLLAAIGFLLLSTNENLIDEKWMVHCLSCFG